MEIIIIGTVEDAQEYQGKNGYGCNIKISQLQDKRRKELSFSTKNPLIGKILEEKLQEEVTIRVILEQNNFGLRITDVKRSCLRMESSLVIDVEVFKFLHNLGFSIVALLTCVFVALLVLILQ